MTAIAQWLWQGMVLALAVTAVLRWAPRVNATTRYAVWWLTLAATLALPGAGAIVRSARWLLAAPVMATAAPVTVGGETGLWMTWPAPVADAGEPWLALPAAPDWLIACAIGLWLGTVILGCARLVAGARTVRQLKRDARPLPPSVVAALRSDPGHVRGAELRWSSAIDGACALGLTGRPVVLLSPRLVSALEPDALDLIVLHELVHLKRYDDWWRAVQSCVLVVAGLHPAIRFISGRIDAEREVACDEAVAAHTGEPRRYAASLAAVADLLALGRSARSHHALVSNAVSNGSLVSRVRRLLDPRGCRHANVQAGTVVAVVMCLAGAFAGLGRLHPIVAMTVVPPDAPLTRTATAPPLDGHAMVGGGPLPSARPAGTRVGARRQPRPRRPDERRASTRVVLPAADPSGRPGDEVAARPPLDQPGRRAPGEVPTTGTVVDLAPLPATPLSPANGAIFAIRRNDVRNREGSGDNGWTSAGAPAIRAGAAIGGYFSRAGKAVASRF